MTPDIERSATQPMHSGRRKGQCVAIEVRIYRHGLDGGVEVGESQHCSQVEVCCCSVR